MSIMPIQLNREWSDLMEAYRADHQDQRNQLCHSFGIPLIAASIPVGMTLVGLPAAVAMFSAGWVLQFAGHAFEGKKPSFATDRRQLIVGLLWWTQKAGLKLVRDTPPAA